MFKILVKIALVIIIAAVIGCGIGKCVATTVQAAEVSDWKQCNVKLLIANPTGGTLYYYNLLWIDHDIEKYRGTPVPRCGGEVQPQKFNTLSKDFRLCLGRHIMVWHKKGEKKPIIQRFTITPDMTSLVLTPDGLFPKFNLFYKAPKMEDA